MKLPENIRIEIEKNGDKEVILEVVNRLQSDGVAITRDIGAAIIATIESSKGVLE